MKSLLRSLPIYLALALGIGTVASCRSDNDIYPNVVTDIVDALTDSDGNLTSIEMDDGTLYPVSNPKQGLISDSRYRVLCGYALQDDKVTLYTLQSCYYLRDSSAVVSKDACTIVSAWKTPKCINLHLQVKTQGGKHYWGYVTDSIVDNHAYLSLHHRQNNDPEAYTTDVYASIPLDSIDAQKITLQQHYEYTK